MQPTDLTLLQTLLSIDSPAGDEYRMADWLTNWIGANIEAARIERLRDCLIVVKGDPKVAIFAHSDTNGFTVGYDVELIPIGSPQCENGDIVRRLGDTNGPSAPLAKHAKNSWKPKGLASTPGDRLVFGAKPIVADGRVRAPYLDNRAGVWAALKTLQQCENIAVAFTTGEEVTGSGAVICARHLYDNLKITKALISDITWDTDHVHCGQGVAISRRDRLLPSQRYVDQVIELAKISGIPFQIEIESSGGSDGMGIERSGCPIDWVFIGAPEERPHSATESVVLDDLDAMAAMLTYVVDNLAV